MSILLLFLFFFFNDTATTEIYPLSLHDALPIFPDALVVHLHAGRGRLRQARHHVSRHERMALVGLPPAPRSEEHTSELQSLTNLVCRLLLEKKNYRLYPECSSLTPCCYQ